MSEIKHAPGPWQIDPDWGPCEEHPEWASINIGPGHICVSGHIGAANAHIIAAAPDLLQELQNIANADTAEWDDPSEFEAWAKSRARAAIHKAIGAEQ